MSDYLTGCRWFLSTKLGDEWIEREVTREEWIRAERMAGFRPKYYNTHEDLQPATGGWSYGNMSGRIEYPKRES